MMKASPAAAFIMAKADLLLEFLIVPLDAPAQFSGIRSSEMSAARATASI